MLKRRDRGSDDSLDVLSEVRARLRAAHLLDALAAGAVSGAVAGGLARGAGSPLMPAGVLAASVAAGVCTLFFALRRAERTRQIAAARLQRAVPDSHNVIVTAAELLAHPDRARAWMRTRVIADANRMLAGVEPADIIPLRLRLSLCAICVAAPFAILAAVDPQTPTTLTQTVDRVSAPARDASPSTSVSVTLEPPVHTALPITTLAQPERISAVEGTRLTLRVAGLGAAARIRFTDSRLVAQQADAGTIAATLVLKESGYLAIEGDGRTELIPVAVTPDRAPVVVVQKPGQDLLVADAARALAVEASATDDFGLRALALRYTKVSGSGEQFEFVEGDIPLGVVRHDARTWSGRGAIDLSQLGLAAGDSLVYRVVAHDARTGDAGLAASETFFIEVAGPGQVSLQGFEMPPDRERHALSQQMIVVKIERLRDRRLPRESAGEDSHAIAAEQRAVRAQFVFLMGGHVEDEEEEAEQSHEIQEGRLENTARREITGAIDHMVRAEQALVAVDLTAAHRQAKLAADALQRAFGRNRYLLRTLPVRARIDPSRRLTGTLQEARDWIRVQPSPDSNAHAITDLLAFVVANGEGLTRPGAPTSAAALTTMTEKVLAIDPANPAWQQVSAGFAAVHQAAEAGGDRQTLERKLEEAVTLLMVEARRAAALRSHGIDRGSPLRGAWADEVRRK